MVETREAYDNMAMGNEQFISEPLKPDEGTCDIGAMARGEPGLPRGFAWGKEHITVARVLDCWKTNSRGEGHTYLRRHWFRIITADGRTMTLYFMRQAKAHQPRWWLYTIES